jgi:hypothetical protein
MSVSAAECRRSHAASLSPLLSRTEAKRRSWCWPAVGIAAARPRNLTANGTSNDQLDTFQSVTHGQDIRQLSWRGHEEIMGGRGSARCTIGRSWTENSGLARLTP